MIRDMTTNELDICYGEYKKEFDNGLTIDDYTDDGSHVVFDSGDGQRTIISYFTKSNFTVIFEFVNQINLPIVSYGSVELTARSLNDIYAMQH